MNVKHILRAFWRKTFNTLIFKDKAPLYGELIWIDPKKCVSFLEDQYFRDFFGLRLRQASGLVVDTWPASHIYSIKEHPKLLYCLKHWVGGKTWHEAGAVDFMLKNISNSPKGCRITTAISRMFWNVLML